MWHAENVTVAPCRPASQERGREAHPGPRRAAARRFSVVLLPQRCCSGSIGVVEETGVRRSPLRRNPEGQATTNALTPIHSPTHNEQNTTTHKWKKTTTTTAVVAAAAVAEKAAAGSKAIEGQARPIFPFTAIVGQEEMKLALILNVIDPKIGGVMIMGDRGTGKSTTIRALADLLPEMRVVDKDPFNSGEREGDGMG